MGVVCVCFHRNQVLYPLVVTDLLGKYNVWASVKGGGLTGELEVVVGSWVFNKTWVSVLHPGQAGAVRLGLSKALTTFPGIHSCILESGMFLRSFIEQFGSGKFCPQTEGLLVRDHRMVERKKPGQLKARKKFAWLVFEARKEINEELS